MALTKYQEILRNKKGIIYSGKTGPALEFINFMRSQPPGYKKTGSNYVSTIKDGFLVRYKKWSNRLSDIFDIDGTLLFVHVSDLDQASMEPKCGAFDSDDKYEDIVKKHLREKKLNRVLNLIQ